MRRLICTSSLVILLSVGLTEIASADGPAPPESHAFGRTLGGWMESYWTWILGGDQEGQVKKVVFMPLPAGEPISEDCPTVLVGELDVSLRPGDKFVLPMFAYVGETYLEDVEDDNPDDIPAELFTSADVVLKVDGKVVLDSSVDDLNAFYFDTIYFDEPIFFPEPEPRGDVNAIGAIWVKGIGFAYPPLSKGDHVMELYVDTGIDLIGSGGDCTLTFINTWNISVEQ